MKFLVFGRSGQLASALKDMEKETGDSRVIALGREKIDIRKLDSVKQGLAEHKPDLLINAAAYTNVDQAENESREAFELNAKAIENILEAADPFKLPIIHISTDYVFDGTSREPYNVEDEARPLGIYGASKLSGERILQENYERHIIIRTAWIYSPYGKNFVKTMLRMMERNDSINVIDDQYGCPTSAHELAFSLLKIGRNLCRKDFADFGTYHLVSGGRMSWFAFAKEIQLQFNRLHQGTWKGSACEIKPISSQDYPAKAQRPVYSVLSSVKFEKTFDIYLPYWKKSLIRCLQQLKEDKDSG